MGPDMMDPRRRSAASKARLAANLYRIRQWRIGLARRREIGGSIRGLPDWWSWGPPNF